MKKAVLFVSALLLVACQAPMNRNVYRAVGPRVCYEYNDSFRCSAPTQVWNETIYPKNEIHTQYGHNTYVPYQPMSLSQAVYGY